MIDNFDNFKKVWDSDPLIVLDTNVFLRLYSQPPEMIEQFIEILRSAKDKIWLPAQVVQEFEKNHKKEHGRNFNKYEVFLKQIQSTIEKNKNTLEGDFIKHLELKYPLIDELKVQVTGLIDEMQKATVQYKDNIQQQIDNNTKVLREDAVKKFVYELVESGATGKRFSLAETISLYQEGEIRFKHLIPPGYEDASKDADDPTKQRKFGDLILWKQTLSNAKLENKSVIFVTNDVKEDWWVLVNNQPSCARYELSQEFSEIVGEKFIMSTGQNLFRYISSINQIEIEIDTHLMFLEEYSDDLIEELFDGEDWSVILNNKHDLEFYLIHSGDLQPYIDDAISDVEITGYPGDSTDVELTVESIDYHHEKAFIQGSFATDIEIAVSSFLYSEEITSTEGKCSINGSFSVEFTLDDSDDELSIKVGTSKFTVGGFSISGYEETKNYLDDYNESCSHCNSDVVYYTDSGDGVCENHKDLYDYCPGCNTLFEKGSLSGGLCNSCD
ncbi:PIN domain-containing protein [Paenibacillus illinoisensis]|uniref:PIN domain-containing protein n=1 Tax=Paenibacillus illinoisensis TaxID=59845 RepID=UPI00301D535A